jgi:hypothetical protein
MDLEDHRCGTHKDDSGKIMGEQKKRIYLYGEPGTDR